MQTPKTESELLKEKSELDYELEFEVSALFNPIVWLAMHKRRGEIIKTLEGN